MNDINQYSSSQSYNWRNFCYNDNLDFFPFFENGRVSVSIDNFLIDCTSLKPTSQVHKRLSIGCVYCRHRSAWFHLVTDFRIFSSVVSMIYNKLGSFLFLKFDWGFLNIGNHGWFPTTGRADQASNCINILRKGWDNWDIFSHF
jgi:hypothetical protein